MTIETLYAQFYTNFQNYVQKLENDPILLSNYNKTNKYKEFCLSKETSNKSQFLNEMINKFDELNKQLPNNFNIMDPIIIDGVRNNQYTYRDILGKRLSIYTLTPTTIKMILIYLNASYNEVISILKPLNISMLNISDPIDLIIHNSFKEGLNIDETVAIINDIYKTPTPTKNIQSNKFINGNQYSKTKIIYNKYNFYMKKKIPNETKEEKIERFKKDVLANEESIFHYNSHQILKTTYSLLKENNEYYHQEYYIENQNSDLLDHVAYRKLGIAINLLNNSSFKDEKSNSFNELYNENCAKNNGRNENIKSFLSLESHMTKHLFLLISFLCGYIEINKINPLLEEIYTVDLNYEAFHKDTLENISKYPIEDILFYNTYMFVEECKKKGFDSNIIFDKAKLLLRESKGTIKNKTLKNHLKFFTDIKLK